MTIYAMSEFDTLDLLANAANIEKVEFGVVVQDQFGLGLHRRGKSGSHLLSGQATDFALKQLGAAESAEIVVFYGKGWIGGKEVLLPTELGFTSPEVEAAVEQRKQRLADIQPKQVFDVAHIWF